MCNSRCAFVGGYLFQGFLTLYFKRSQINRKVRSRLHRASPLELFGLVLPFFVCNWVNRTLSCGIATAVKIMMQSLIQCHPTRLVKCPQSLHYSNRPLSLYSLSDENFVLVLPWVFPPNTSEVSKSFIFVLILWCWGSVISKGLISHPSPSSVWCVMIMYLLKRVERNGLERKRETDHMCLHIHTCIQTCSHTVG